MLKKYVDKVLNSTKKPLDFERIISKINNLICKENLSNIELSLDQIDEITTIINNGVKDFKYIKTINDKYISILKTSFRKGCFYGNRNGDGKVLVLTEYETKSKGYVIKEDFIEVCRNNSKGAIDGDVVLIDLGKNENKIVEILERKLDNIIGEVYAIGKNFFVRPADKKKQALTVAIAGNFIEGERVLVNLKEQTGPNYYIGEVLQKFNNKDDPDADILWEASKYGIDNIFSKDSIEQAMSLPQSVRDVDKIGRSDLTNWEIFTIDGEDTKDIDDAISCKMADNTNNYLLGVHIADVSYYVPKNSPLDIDAYRKGTSNYLGGKVLPMLRCELSNGICSLNPNVDRLAISCIMEINSDGEVINYNIVQSVIHSSLKMSYNKVNDILKNGKVDLEYSQYIDSLKLLNKLALILRKKRIKNGAIEFNRSELKPVYNEEGKVVDFSVRTQDLAENLIEECMLVANETVDKHLCNLGFPCLHRVHNTPNSEKLASYFRLLEIVNYPFYKYSVSECLSNSSAMKELLEHIKNTGKISNMLSLELIKCMSRAKYSPVNIGHSGLAKNNYCHFTSPIRRYPDLTIHRLLDDLCFNYKDRLRKAKEWELHLYEIGEHCSKMEKNANRAEESVLQMKCCEYMENHIGEEFECIIVGLSQHGITIQLDNMIEGRIRLGNLGGEYIYNPETYTLIAMEQGENYYIGDTLKVIVTEVNKEKKIIDFKVVSKIDENYIENSDESNQYVKKIAK